MLKLCIWVGLFVGSTLGGMVPQIWGDAMLSGWGVILSMVGGFVGIWAGYKLGRMM